MKKINRLVISGVFVLGIGSIAMLPIKNKTNDKEIVYSHSVIASYDKNQLVNDATVVISGEVISSEMEMDFLGLPATDYKIKVNNVIKGELVSEVEVRTQGGSNEDIEYIPGEDMVSFEIGEKVTLFLTDDKGDRPDKDDFGYFVLGQKQGKFIEKDGKLRNEIEEGSKLGNSKFEFDASNLASELKQIDEENKRNNLKKMDSEQGEEI